MNDIRKVQLERAAFANGLTNLQVSALNEIGQDIEDGADDLESYDGLLSEAEEKYLKARLGEPA